MLGYRDRQIRVVRHLGDWHVGLSYENGKDFLPKLVHDSKRLHWELIGVAGAGGHKGISAAVVLHAARKLDVVSQQYWSRGGGRDALSTVPANVRMHSTLEGLEIKVGKGLQVFGYAGLVHGERSAGNRTAREWTAGLSQDLYNMHKFGSAVLSVEFSQMDRSTWGGGYGAQNVFMASVRHYFGLQ